MTQEALGCHSEGPSKDLAMAKVPRIRTEQDYESALAEIEPLMATEPGTPEGNRLDRLVSLVQAWEALHHRIEPV
jgi:HTH-type transcriptional regulator/antitoxin HigA